jgi:hypothetical protein
MEDHIKAVGWCFIIYYGLITLFGVFFFLVTTGVLARSNPRAIMVVGPAIAILAALFIIIALPGLITGFALLKFRSWARVVAITLGLLNLFIMPVGTALGIYTLWVLLNRDSLPLFE